jgi:hypothetical protein
LSKFFFPFFPSKKLLVISKQPWPDILITAIAPTPEAVAGAIIISLKIDLDGSNGLN